jgi:hypothetical protein
MWTATGNMATERYRHTATLLPNGQVLVTGGNANPGSAEVYDPATGSWMPTKNLSPSRSFHAAPLLQNGNVLVSGGEGSARYGVLRRSQLYQSSP